MDIEQPFFIVPKLIEQPTWGGDYIVRCKDLAKQPSLQDKKIGQAFELAGTSKLIALSELVCAENLVGYERTKQAPHVFELADCLIDDEYFKTTPLGDLIEQEAEAVLGKRVVERYGKSMPLLIKFTQALGNSFQLHVREQDEQVSGWLAKPETWYFFVKGYVTLGIKPGADLDAYKQVCEAIEIFMKDISQKVESEKLKIDEARIAAWEFVRNENPWQFINCLHVDAGQVVDPSAGGIHHSWEEDAANCPLGNIVYEVQLDRADDASTMRSFDKGKLKDDGTIRAVQIDDYFRYLDDSEEANDLSCLLKKPQPAHKKNSKVELLFQTRHYACERIVLGKDASTWADETQGSFHHLFVKKGRIEIADKSDQPTSIVVDEGWSVFYPAVFGHYRFGSVGGEGVEVLKTYVPR